MKTEGDRRSFERFSARFPAKIKDSRQSYGTEVFLRDASAQGMRLVTRERFFLDDKVAVDVALPQGHQMDLSGRVVWAKLLDYSFWELGVRFDSVDLLKMQRLFKLTEATKS
jgi:hypothetical protein